MNIKLKQPQLSNLVSSVNSICDEATMIMHTDHLELRGLELGKIALVECNYNKADLESYEVESKLLIGLRLNELAKVIKRFDKSSSVVRRTEADQLVLENPDKTFMLKLVEGKDGSRVPELQFLAKAVFSAETLKTHLDDIHTLGNWLTVNTKDGQLQFSGTADGGESKVNPKTEQLEITGETDVDFSLEFLTKMIRAVDGVKNITLQLGASATPMKVTFDDGKIVGYLAPRARQ